MKLWPSASRKFARGISVAGGSLLGVLACGAVGAGAVSATSIGLVVYCAVGAFLMMAVSRRFRFVAPSARAQRRSSLLAHATSLADVELGLALVSGLYASFALTGAQESPLYPLLYGTMAFVATFI